ncbi:MULTISPECIES: GIY-YIG nuclease family protein [Lacticaseibacillus]|uniref:GIY-YIG nuclease family protein n=2 Tax=Lacticaseibacillus TaxID=2759736 RepID=A0ABD7Z626_LACZE|nr:MULTISPECIES: GIY-YIG nuclease family protein [Lacticaseibacillus]OFS01130.1 endonuclease [Lactobacillus sp. HMSC068F07]KLI76616.1 endonuclease [Lacticaseibacillus casei]MDE3282543.1 GIY-YIG nuclease family protein [Lacticaseibacillus casei]MDE3315343.1 GIY-YIG nuclease family protein [Lacticaseibacillus zeae]WLV82410.1 GIY-YIG nuclease family protein [Lacticaseibacillus sp. NCIMB 15475]
MVSKYYYFYVLLCADGTFYGGFTDDVEARLATHNAGKGAKYTASRRPVRLLYQEAFPEKHEALSAEWHFKHQSRHKKEQFLTAHHVKWQGLSKS